jgi:hypothetical protein
MCYLPDSYCERNDNYGTYNSCDEIPNCLCKGLSEELEPWRPRINLLLQDFSKQKKYLYVILCACLNQDNGDCTKSPIYGCSAYPCLRPIIIQENQLVLKKVKSYYTILKLFLEKYKDSNCFTFGDSISIRDMNNNYLQNDLSFSSMEAIYTIEYPNPNTPTSQTHGYLPPSQEDYVQPGPSDKWSFFAIKNSKNEYLDIVNSRWNTTINDQCKIMVNYTNYYTFNLPNGLCWIQNPNTQNYIHYDSDTDQNLLSLDQNSSCMFRIFGGSSKYLSIPWQNAQVPGSLTPRYLNINNFKMIIDDTEDDKQDDNYQIIFSSSTTTITIRDCSVKKASIKNTSNGQYVQSDLNLGSNPFLWNLIYPNII